MTELRKIKSHVRQIIDRRFEVVDVTSVPYIGDRRLTFGNKGLRFPATVLYIDLRGSTKLLNRGTRNTAAKVHTAYYHAIATVAQGDGGEIRSFNGDSMLVFFPGSGKKAISKAVRSAMRMHYVLSHEKGIFQKISKYAKLDFGIGIDHGTIIASKVGIRGKQHTQDIFWAGNAVNKAAKLGDSVRLPRAVAISAAVHEKLEAVLLTTEQTLFYGYTQQANVWRYASINYNGSVERYYVTDESLIVK